MKIGILTHHYINNFGAFLQAYALQKAVKNLFPDDEVLIINHVNIKHFIINTLGWFRFYKDCENLGAWLQKIKLPLSFYKARKSYLNMTKLCLLTNNINNLGFDCIIIGSDEVWNYQDEKCNTKLKFGVGLNCKNIIAYAPSVGKSEDYSRIPEYAKEGLKRFSALSARDDLTATFTEVAIGKVSTKVLDPTFLYKFPEVKSVVPKKSYILFYYCEKLPKEYIDEIISFANKSNYAIYGAGECNKIYNQVTVNLTPFEWVQMFRGAEFVFTGTFHGVVFSILNKKQFACYLTNTSRIKKVGALLREFNIKERIIDERFDLTALINNFIDYEKVYEYINEQRERSMQYLVENIKRKR